MHDNQSFLFLSIPMRMSRVILIPIVLLLTWLGGGTWYWVCQVRGLCDEQQDAMSLEPSVMVGLGDSQAASGLTITYHDKVWLSRDEHIRFARHEAKAQLSKRMAQTLEHLALHLQSHEDLEVEIIGGYLPEEKNHSSSPNLGLGRAAFVQGVLMKHGVAEERFIKLPRTIPDSLFVNDTLHGGIELRLLDRQLGYGTDSAVLESLIMVQQAQVKAWAYERLTLRNLEEGELALSGYDQATVDSLIAAKQTKVNAWARERLKLSALEKGELNLVGYEPGEVDSVIQARQAQMEAWARERLELSALEQGKIDLSAYDQATIDSLLAAKQAQVAARAREWLAPSDLERGKLSRQGYDSAAIEALIAKRQAQVNAWAQARIEESPLERGEMSFIGYDSTTVESLRMERQTQLAALARVKAERKQAPTASKPSARRFYFAYNRFDLLLDDEARDYLTEVIQFMRRQPQAKLTITGHADKTGDAKHNLGLSRKRAKTMQDFFEAFGLPRTRSQLAYKGDTQPLASNDTEAGRAQNRRVEVVIELPQ